MKSETILLTLLGGAVLVSSLHHNNVYRDEYASKEDCERDWHYERNPCTQSSGGGSAGSGGGAGGRYYGPSYERDARPATVHPELRQGTTLVNRGGFGRSGARFSGGG